MSHALLEAWQKTLRRHGAARALRSADGRARTFRELDAGADAWLQAHAPQGAPLKGRAVVFAAPNEAPWLELFLALLKAGAIAVPLDPAEPALARQRLATTLRAGFWWDGSSLVALKGAKPYRDSRLCFIKTTSGTTGRPKALVFTADQLLADARQVTASMGITSRDVNYALIPFGHSYGLGNLVLPLLVQGTPVICGSSPLPHAIAADFASWKPTVFAGVPTLWRALSTSDVTLPGLRLAISAGAPLPPEIARDFAARFGQPVHSFYGSSETGGISYDRSGTATLAGGVGTALRGVKLIARPGERLQVSSPAVITHGNRRRSGRQGAYVMPDRVAMDGRGGVTLLGRRGTTVKIAGRRVNLAEVADRLRRIPGVREVWTDVSRDREPVLGAVVAATQTAAELRVALAVDTAAWKIPRKLVVVAALPTTARGKTDLAALQALLF